ncbi:hypothetical protein ACULML_17740 [Xanthomonas arboricola pv. corylina]|uniref:hypothetical protein n=1 Tax=Xanthomonas arboricola TaxID=56448 RepID=UPI004040A9B2
MDASTARTENMRRLVAQAGGPSGWIRNYGAGRWQQAQVSQWISETNPKGIGHKLARDLEVVMGLPHGHLDLQMEAIPAASHPAGLSTEMISNAVRIAQHVRDAALEPMPDETFVEVLAAALQLVASRQEGSANLPQAAREVAAKFRAKG